MARKNHRPTIMEILDQSAQINAAVTLAPQRNQQLLFKEYAKQEAKTAQNAADLLLATKQTNAQVDMLYPQQQRQADEERLQALKKQGKLSPAEQAERDKLQQRLSQFKEYFESDYNVELLLAIGKRRKEALKAITG